MKQLADQQYQRLFKTSPGKILVLRPDSYEIVAVTDTYLQATLTRESDIVGKTLFEVFPDNPADEQADGVRNLFSSLQRVKLLKTADNMGIQRYPVRLPDGAFEERFWSPVNSPVLDGAGEIEFIMHRVEDVTAIVRERTVQKAVSGDGNGDPIEVQDIILRSHELRQTLTKLQEYEARMRTAERMLSLGSWEYHPRTGDINWSQQVFDIYDVPASQPAPNFEEYFTLVHPDDREASRAVYAAFAEKNSLRLEFEHRVIARDGEVRYVKGVGERVASSNGEIVVGFVQNITAFIRTRHKLTQAEQLLRLAGEKVRLGGWRVELDSETVIWTSETAAIHSTPAGYSPSSVSEAINFYAPEYRELIQNVFTRCANHGEEFDVVCQILTLDGRRPWVRVIGIAERDADGRVSNVQGAFQDISSLREAQEMADKSNRQVHDILESIGDAFFSVDAEWNFTYVNQHADILLERQRRELLGKNIWDEFPEAVGSEFQRQYELAVECQQTARFQEFYPALGKWFDVSAYPIPDGLAVYFRDVTSEREYQRELRLVGAALSRQNDIVMITDAESLDAPDGPRIIYVNHAFERLTGYTKSEAIGRSPRFLQGPASDRRQLDRIRHALQNKQSVRCDVLNYKKSGESYWLELDISPLFNDKGHCTHFVAVERDITQRRQQEAALRLAQERFELISRATNDVIWDWNLTTNEIWWNDLSPNCKTPH